MSQSLTGVQQKDDQFLQEGQGMQFWLEKVVAWGQSDNAEARSDTCRHLSRLRDFLREVLRLTSETCSTTETMKKLPDLGQFLGRLCWNPFVTADDTCRGLIFQCLWGLYSERPSNSVEKKANQWIQKVLCQLATEDNATTEMLMKHMNMPPADYHLKLLRKMVAMLQDRVAQHCGLLGDVNQRCSCDSVLAVSEACVPLATYAEAAPLIGALLQRPSTCAKATLSEHFLNELSAAYSSHSLLLEDQAVISLWYHSLPCLENAVVTLLESVLTSKASTLQELEQRVGQSLLPKACAQHCSMFFIVNDIFRNLLQKQEENESLRSLIQTFTSCFYRELKLLQPQARVSLRSFFPQTPHSLLVPLLTQPSEMPGEAWRHHLNWLSGSLQRLTEEEEEEEHGDRSNGRGHQRVFEAWFLLVQCGGWVQVATELVTTTEPEHNAALLWLLTFYHHPTNRGHHRDLQLVRAKEAAEHLRLLFSTDIHPLPVDGLQKLVALLSPPAQQPVPSPSLILDLLVNSAVFSQQSESRSAETLHKAVEASGLLGKAAGALASLELRLNRQTDRVHLRMEALRNALARTHTHAAQSPR